MKAQKWSSERAPSYLIFLKICLFIFEIGSYCVDRTIPTFLSLSNPPDSASWLAETAGMGDDACSQQSLKL